MWLEETISPSTSTSVTTRVSKRPSAASIAGSPAARWPKRKFSPTDTCVACSRSTSTWSMNSCGLWRANSSSNAITTSSRTPSVAISSTLASRLVSSFGAASGRITAQRVRLERQHRVAAGDHLAVTEVDAVELADGDPPRPRLRVLELRHLHCGGSLRAIASRPPAVAAPAPARARASATSSPSSGQAHRAAWRIAGDIDRAAMPDRPGLGVVELERWQEVQRVDQRERAFGIGVCDIEGPDPRAAQLLAIGVAEVGDQAPDVGARRALDRIRAAVAVTPPLSRTRRSRPRVRGAQARCRRAPARRPVARRP